MSLKSLSAVAVLAMSAWCAAPMAWAQDPTVSQVYQAAEAGKLVEAQAMMDKVLQAHPNSGKAHYVDAELLARQGKFDQARTELATAERLSPGLPFAKPAAVQQLRTLLAQSKPAPAARASTIVPDTTVASAMAAPAAASAGIPWGMILGIVAVLAAVWLFLRSRATKRAEASRYGSTAGPGAPPGAGYPQYGSPGNAPAGPGMPGMPGMGAPGGGLGSGIVGGLATGAALGAGMVAGQALAHRFTEGDHAGNDSNANHLAPGADPLANRDPLLAPEPPADYGMGGSDFGVSDPGSWDGGGGGDDDWN